MPVWPIGGGTVPFLVAASDSPDEIKAASNYVCTGINDHLVINQAINDGWGTNGSNNHIILSVGSFFIGGTLDYVALIEGAGRPGTAGWNGSILRTSAAVSSMVSCQVGRNFEIIAGHAVTTAVTSYQADVTGIRVAGSVGTAFMLGQGAGAHVSSVAVDGASVGVDANGGPVMIASSWFRDCAVAIYAPAESRVSVGSSIFTDIPTGGVGIHLQGGSAAVGACHFTGASGATGTVGIHNAGGTLNAGAAGANTFVGVATPIL